MMLRDCPVIENMERYGYPDGREEPKQPLCPVCFGEADTFYVDRWSDIVGCENCVRRSCAWEVQVESV
ncbi:MAG: hypothetical protein DDT19_02490 [Syntrophomonadaceae bacterium]|nr:hypothetical protein [Bacillota bacterium]